ncbi:Transcription factor IIIA [Hyphodiscus hymeniophilus]|uniref:Transcription factor IIIA n=1 Tax=Hyphodiscus hymeniophilus TaxID=353542 RepID=A0A9P6VF51_9HELO|nr:Transcription factor IIIA [Hyphodiscus hymeniophilus]
MATGTRKRKALEQVEPPSKKARVVQLGSVPGKQRFNIIHLQPTDVSTVEDQFSDDESEDDLQEDGDEDGKSDFGAKSADTPLTPFSPRKNFPSNLKTLKCSVEGCTKSFNRPSRLANHLKAHSNERTFLCTYEGCDKSYFEQKHLAQHIKGSHTHERSYECNWEGCIKSFLTATRLRRHIETHEGHSRFKCTAYPPCSQEFRKHQTLQRHIRSDHLQLSPYPCTYVDPITSESCNAGFDGAVGLRKHEDQIHSIPRFFCPNCTLPGINPDGSAIHLGFMTTRKLQNHIKKEHANCPFCDRKCSSQRELHKHVESQHSGKPLEVRKNISCTYEGCDKTFTKKYNRDVHVRTQHEGSRFICGTFQVTSIPDLAAFDNHDACGKDFVSKANLEDHIRTAHLNLPSRINANRKKSAPNSEDEDETSDYDSDGEPKPKTAKAKGKKVKSSVMDDLLGLSYTNDPRRNIHCLVTTCPHLFIRDYDLQQHMRTKHRLSTPEIEDLAHEDENQPDFHFAPGDLRNNDAYGEEGGGEDVDWDIQAQNMNNTPFWLGGGDDEIPIDQWAQDELEMRQLIAEEPLGDPFDAMDSGTML